MRTASAIRSDESAFNAEAADPSNERLRACPTPRRAGNVAVVIRKRGELASLRFI